MLFTVCFPTHTTDAKFAASFAKVRKFPLDSLLSSTRFCGFLVTFSVTYQAEVQDVHEKEDSPQSGMATSSDFNDFRFRSALIRIHDFMRNQQTMPMLFACCHLTVRLTQNREPWLLAVERTI